MYYLNTISQDGMPNQKKNTPTEFLKLNVRVLNIRSRAINIYIYIYIYIE